jgi:ubiquinone/menaquinone biosynthesis C-methylase UbiE
MDERRVREANRLFYDTAADVYEEIDGRRSEDVIALLDLGCGTGLVMRIGARHFHRVYGIDISLRILADIKTLATGAVSGDVCCLPFVDECFDAVSCFAVLHHLYDHRALFHEVYRVLKPGGVLYTDHDMDAAFMQRFYWPMQIYRWAFDMGRRYQQAKHELTKELYQLSEVHANGIATDVLVNEAMGAGFRRVTAGYHWLGLQRLVNMGMRAIGSPRALPRSWAPLATIWAIK